MPVSFFTSVRADGDQHGIVILFQLRGGSDISARLDDDTGLLDDVDLLLRGVSGQPVRRYTRSQHPAGDWKPFINGDVMALFSQVERRRQAAGAAADHGRFFPGRAGQRL
jgi:hypothetical protein